MRRGDFIAGLNPLATHGWTLAVAPGRIDVPGRGSSSGKSASVCRQVAGFVFSLADFLFGYQCRDQTSIFSPTEPQYNRLALRGAVLFNEARDTRSHDGRSLFNLDGERRHCCGSCQHCHFGTCRPDLGSAGAENALGRSRSSRDLDGRIRYAHTASRPVRKPRILHRSAAGRIGQTASQATTTTTRVSKERACLTTA
jgi:hypothetical protein